MTEAIKTKSSVDQSNLEKNIKLKLKQNIGKESNIGQRENQRRRLVHSRAITAEKNRLRPCETKLTGIRKYGNIHHGAHNMSSAMAEAVDTKSFDGFPIRMPIIK